MNQTKFFEAFPILLRECWANPKSWKNSKSWAIWIALYIGVVLGGGEVLKNWKRIVLENGVS